MELPEIKSGPVESLADCISEYQDLTALLAVDKFDDGATSWSRAVSGRITDRMAYLEKTIAQKVTLNWKDLK